MILRDDAARQRWRWPHFTPEEMACKHCGALSVDTEFMDRLEDLRHEYGRPMVVSSGYRCPAYNETVSTTGPKGPHTTGCAVDISVRGRDAYDLLQLAVSHQHAFTGIGINQKGAGRFLHLDSLQAPWHPRPALWTY